MGYKKKKTRDSLVLISRDKVKEVQPSVESLTKRAVSAVRAKKSLLGQR